MNDFFSQFGFRTTPFTRELEVSDRFALPQFEEALQALEHTVEQRRSAALIAPSGMGKTALLRALLARLPQARYRTHYVKVTSLSRRDMCREIAAVLGFDPHGTYATLIRALQAYFLSTLENEGLRPLLVLDECHDMRPEVLSMLRLLTNFEMDSSLVLSVVLCGQPLLGRLLRREELEDVARRIAHYATLRLLTREETQRYVEHRSRCAGARTCPFDKSAFETLYELARGNLRAIDHLALKSLELAHGAGDSAVGAGHVSQARTHLWP
jgi:general secretion pathway protein A